MSDSGAPPLQPHEMDLSALESVEFGVPVEGEAEVVPSYSRGATGICSATTGVPRIDDLDWARFWTSAQEHFESDFPLEPDEPVLWALASENGRDGIRPRWPLFTIWVGLAFTTILGTRLLSGDPMAALLFGGMLSIVPMSFVLTRMPQDRHLGLFLTDRRLLIVGLTGKTEQIAYSHLGKLDWRRRYLLLGHARSD